MFKNLIVYRLAPGQVVDFERLAEGLDADRFAPCGATQSLSAGWVPPRGEPGAALLEAIDGHWLATLRIEKRVLPTSVVRERAQLLAERVEEQTGRRPGRKQMRDLKEQSALELLPQAFRLQSHVKVWISPGQGLLMVDATSESKADETITMLVKADRTLQLHLLSSAESPAACMSAWLMDGVPPDHFVVDRDCEVKAADEMKAAVRYTRHNLDTDELKGHLTSGKMPTRLAMTWRERVSFTLTAGMSIKSIKFLDVVFDGRDKPAKDEAFDVDAAIATGEIAQLIPDLIEGLGGELDFIGQSAAQAVDSSDRPTVNANARDEGGLHARSDRGILAVRDQDGERQRPGIPIGGQGVFDDRSPFECSNGEPVRGSAENDGRKGACVEAVNVAKLDGLVHVSGPLGEAASMPAGELQ